MKKKTYLTSAKVRRNLFIGDTNVKLIKYCVNHENLNSYRNKI